MDAGFVKADSANLPKVDSFMVAHFFANNPDFSSGLKNVKSSRSARKSYGDDAVGYVQLNMEENICTVQCKMCPEQVCQRPYIVTVTVDVKNSVVESVICDDCSESRGGCKHGVGFLMWMHRRSEEPSFTSVVSFWKKSTLAKTRSTHFVTAKEICGMKPTSTFRANDSVLQEFVKIGIQKKLTNCQILKHQEEYADQVELG